MSRYGLVNFAYGLGSWGDEMILDGLLNRLGRSECVVFSADPDETRRMHHVDAVGLNETIGCQELWIGGSGWGHEPMASIVAQLAAFVGNNARVVVEAAGLREEVDWERYKPSFAGVSRFTVRDSLSQVIARRLGHEATIVPDLSRYMRVAPVDLGPGPWVGVNVAGGYEPLAALVPLVREFARRGYKLVALPTICHKQNPWLDSHVKAAWLAELAGVSILDLPGPWHGRSLGPRELAGVAANCQYTVAMRKHGAYLAARVGVPVLMCDWYADHGLPYRLRQLREVIPDSLYCDLHRGDDPLEVAQGWFKEGG